MCGGGGGGREVLIANIKIYANHTNTILLVKNSKLNYVLVYRNDFGMCHKKQNSEQDLLILEISPNVPTSSSFYPNFKNIIRMHAVN